MERCRDARSEVNSSAPGLVSLIVGIGGGGVVTFSGPDGVELILVRAF